MRGAAEEAGRKGRVEESDVEGAARAAQEGERILTFDPGTRRAPLGEVRAELARGARVVLDEADVRRAARQRLEPERPRARVQIENCQPSQDGGAQE